MKTATLTETKNNLSALIDQVRSGETLLILDRGRPVARLTSAVNDVATTQQGRVSRLERLGVLRRAARPKSPDLFDRPRPKALDDASLSAALLDERRSGR